MERLLSKEMARRILLLSMLHDTENWITTENLSNRLSCSTKTIMMDCRYLENHWSEFLSIETSKKNGVKLVLSSKHSVHEVYTDIIRNSEAFTLMETIFFHPGETSEELEKRCFMSSSTLYRLTKRFKAPLKERNMKLERNPFYIFGKSEREIRYFFTAYFVEAYGIHQWPFQLDKKKIIQFVKRVNKDYQLYLSDIRIIHMAFSIAVTITRISQGFTTKGEMEEKDLIIFEKRKAVHQNYQEELNTIISGTFLSVNRDWYRDFYFTVFWWKFGWDSEKEQKHVKKLCEQLIQQTVDGMNITIDSLSQKKIIKTFENIYCQHMIYPYKNFIIYSRFFYSSRSIRENFVFFSKLISKILFKMERAENFPWKSLYFNEIIHDMVFYWKNLPQLLYNQIGRVSVTVLSDLGKEHAEVIGSVLQMNFPNKINVTTQDRSFFDLSGESQLEETDLYVSNYSNDQLSQNNTIVVEDILSQKDIAELKKNIEKIRLLSFHQSKQHMKKSNRE